MILYGIRNKAKLQVKYILTNDIATEAAITSLAYSNLVVFISVLFCIAGLSPKAAIFYSATSFCIFSNTAIAGVLFTFRPHSKFLLGLVISSVVLNELSLASILVFDYYASNRADTLTGIVILISLSFVSVHLCARLGPPLLFSKCVTVFACFLFLVINPTSIAPFVETIACLLVALLIMLATGYWIIIRREHEMILKIKLEELNSKNEEHNSKLKKVIKENSEAKIRLEEEFTLRQNLISHVGHDLRQPITAASYMLRELEKNENPTPKQTLIADTTACIHSASKMIENIVQFTHYNNLEMEVHPELVDIGSLLRQIKREFLSLANNADCAIICVNTCIYLLIDEDLMMRVLRNLTSNVIKHSDATKMLLGVRRTVDGVSIWVVDNGQGLTGKQGKDFEKIMPSHENGLGLGLKISKNLSHACGATLKYSTKPGEGTVFKIEFPASLVRAKPELQNGSTS